MYEGRLRGRPKPSDDVRAPLSERPHEPEAQRASRYSDDKPEASPEGAARTLRKARPADRRWLRKRYDRPTPRARAPTPGRVVRAEPGWSRSRNARIAALCERLGLRSIVATSGDGLAGVGGIPTTRHRTSRGGCARASRARRRLDDDDEDTDGKSSEDERLERPSIVARTSRLLPRTACRSAT